MDNTVLYKVGYGLYILTAKDGERDNGCVINTLLQAGSAPAPVFVISVSKQNHTHDMVTKREEFNISILTVNAPFEVFSHFGFQSGKDVDKLAGYKGVLRSENGLPYLSEHTNAYLSFKVTGTVDFGSHTMFIANLTDGKSLGSNESVTYDYYQKHIKPKPGAEKKQGYRCNICGYIYEGEPLPPDFICPLCKHGASDFTKL